MDTMGIAALSMDLSAGKLSSQVNISLTKKAMDLQETQAAQMLEMLDSVPTAPVSFGHKLDVYV